MHTKNIALSKLAHYKISLFSSRANDIEHYFIQTETENSKEKNQDITSSDV